MINSVLAKQYHFCVFTIGKNLEGMTEEQALQSSPGGGNCANWVLGHILSTRNAIHRLLGLDPALTASQAERYTRGSDPVTAEQPGLSLAEMQAAIATSQEAVSAAIPKLGPDQLSRVVTLPDPLGEGTIAEHLGLLIFHESYHAGQLGVLRRLAGRAGAIS